MDEHEETLANVPAVRLANALSKCLEVVMILATSRGDANAATFGDALSEPLWRRYCASVPVGERKKGLLGPLGDLVGLASLLDSPTIQGPKEMVRDVVARARDLERHIGAWEETTDPTSDMVSAAIAILDRVRAEGPVP
jgi:hypothetical protein